MTLYIYKRRDVDSCPKQSKQNNRYKNLSACWVSQLGQVEGQFDN